MSWNDFHRRGEVLNAVVDAANERCDGVLPMDVPGASTKFHDDLDLIGALLLKWHTRLSGALERELMAQPLDLEAAVQAAWRATALDLPGVRRVIDRYTEDPTTADMAEALRRAHDKELLRLATSAGRASDESPAAVAVGERIERAARAGNDALVGRIKAVLAAA
jgi:hypothetical protein